MNLTKIKETKQSLDVLMEELYAFVGKSFSDVKPLEGVKPIGCGIRAATVSFSAIRNNGYIMGPSYYLPGIQEEAVRNYLIGDKPSITVLMERLKKLCKEKKVVAKKGTIFLNPNMMDHLGQLRRVMSEDVG